MANGKLRTAYAMLRCIPIFHLPFAIFLLPLLPGCAAIGLVAYKVAGPPAVAAKYTPKQTPMLVLVENYQRQSSASVNGDVLARYVADELSVHNVAPIIAAEKLPELREASGASFAKLSISAIGKAAGAAQVLYVQVIRDEITPLEGGEALQGETIVRIKLVDVQSGDTLWPTDLSEGHEMSNSTTLGSDSSRSVRDVRQKLYLGLADQIAKLFYKWKPEK